MIGLLIIYGSMILMCLGFVVFVIIPDMRRRKREEQQAQQNGNK
jgi:hypothetical protein